MVYIDLRSSLILALFPAFPLHAGAWYLHDGSWGRFLNALN